MPGNKYWQERFSELEEAMNQKAVDKLGPIRGYFEEAKRDIEKSISSWYQRYADNNDITMQEARKRLSGRELQDFKLNIEDYIKFGEENALNQKWMKKLENASARAHVSRLESLKLQVEQALQVAFAKQLIDTTTAMKNIFSEQYKSAIYEIQRGLNTGFEINPINTNKLEKIISKPWADDGKNFSDRIWDDREKLVNELHKELTQTVITGDSPDQAINNISEKMDTSKYNASRLVQTESAYFASASTGDAFDFLDIDKYEIVATLDRKTSKICRHMDGETFDMKNFQPGVTASPFHPFCRSTEVPSFDDDDGERFARDAEGQGVYVPGDITYSEWEERFVK